MFVPGAMFPFFRAPLLGLMMLILGWESPPGAFGQSDFKVLLISEVDQQEMVTKFEDGIARVQNSAANVSLVLKAKKWPR